MVEDPGGPYNPLDKVNLARSIAKALLDQEPVALSDVADMPGAGVYVIYYSGGFDLYRPIAEANRAGRFSQPIYVGKAVPKGSRKGGLTGDASVGVALRDRLGQHASSVDQATNLAIADFHYRSLVIEDIWIPLGESILIEEYQPVWNRVIDGFGNKDPGNRRATQYRSPWDVIHPGRRFADKLATGKKTENEIREKVAEYLANQDNEGDQLD